MSLQCRSGHSKPLSVKEQIGGFPQSPISTRLPKRSNALGKWLKKDLSLTEKAYDILSAIASEPLNAH